MNSRPRGFGPFLLATAAITGAVVMAVEVLGSRVIGPYFGVSLFVWTALIAVTLLALAAGYIAGGAWADRFRSATTLYLLIAAAGAWLLIVPPLRHWVLPAMLPYGLRWGALASAAILFGPALFLLGCVSPYLVRLAASEWSRLGSTVGRLYAVSTAGSFAGTLLTGYYFIVEWGVARAFQFGGVLLIALGALYAALFLRRRALLAGPLLAAAWLLPAHELPQAVMPDGTQVRVVDSRDSFYGNVRVVEYSGRAGRTRELVIDGLVQGGIEIDSGQSAYEYGYVLEYLVAGARPTGGRCLVIGLGPGVMPARFAARGMATEVVDIDPAVVAAARRHFALPASIPVHLADARHFLATSEVRYDVIVLDVFNGDTTPGHLISREALQSLRARLAPGGVVAINLVASLGEGRAGSAAILRTVRSVFPWMRIHPLFESGPEGEFGNIAVLAGIGEAPASMPLPARLDVPPQMAGQVLRALHRSLPAPDPNEGLILTDDFNPSDFLDLPLKETVRRRIIETTPIAVLLG